MAARDIVVIGASAGGIAALTRVLARLPAAFAAAIFVVVHVPARTVSRLPEVLARAGPLPAKHAANDEAIVPGQIYVAPPDRHLLVRAGRMEVSRGPRENRARPAIDPLFRSAARVYGSRVVGVILSGALYDGAAGLLAVDARGGTTIVQDPADAEVGSMPLRALNLVNADYVLSAAEISDILVKLVPSGVEANTARSTMVDEERIEGRSSAILSRR